MPLNLSVKIPITKEAFIEEKIIKIRYINKLYEKPHSRNNEAHRMSFAICIPILKQPSSSVHLDLTKSYLPDMELIIQNLIKFCICPACDLGHL